jgi:hypothetical protein
MLLRLAEWEKKEDGKGLEAVNFKLGVDRQ